MKPSFALMMASLLLTAATVTRAEDAPTASPFSLRDKTLVVWVYLAHTNQQGGSALTLMEGEDFDGIVFGERQPGRWMAGSDYFRRTQGGEEQKANPPETASSNTLVQVAITYAGDRISVYRNAQPYAAYPVPQPRAFGSNTTVLLGLRYFGDLGEIGYLTGAIEDARIYDTALTAAQLAALAPNQPSNPKPLAWWTFEDGKADDLMKRFPASRLEGNARVADGKLLLEGDGYLRAAKNAKSLLNEPEEETPFDTSVQTHFYKPRSKRTGNMWDTWLYFHQGDYYLYTLANSRGQWDNISMARSSDGVHWKELGRVLYKGRGVTWMGTGSTWKSPQFEQDGKFFMNFSEWKGPRQTIFFAESKDLVKWTRLGNECEFVQDERWYEKNGRWDCIWTLARPGGGLYGYWTATPKAETGGRFGFGETLDGITWKALAPPKVSGVGEGEVGAIERIGDKYYMMFGTGGLMTTLVADRPEGPFVPASKNFHLLAGHTYFSRFFPMPDGLLVNHHSIARNGQVYFGTLKAARLDAEGTMRLNWWPGNNKLKHQAIDVKPASPRSGDLPTVTMIESEFNARQGLVLEGTLKLPAAKESPPVGLFLAHTNDSGTAILIRAGGITELGPMRADGTGFKAEQRVDREWNYGQAARFRLLLKGSLIEFYLDDLLIQCYSLPGEATGRIGLIQGGQGEAVGNLKAWRASDADASAGSSANPRSDGKAQLQIEYPQKQSIFQRTGNTGEIVIEGVFTGPPGPIEARFNGSPWAQISEGTEPGKFTAVLKGEVGQGALEVRLKQSPEVMVSVPMVSIGDIFVVAGQSNAAGWANQAYEPLEGLPYDLSLYKRNVSTAWEKLRHPATASGNGSPWPITMSYLCRDHRVPIGLITTAIGGAWLKQWLKPSGDHYPAMIATVRAATRGTMKVRAVLWFQGEADVNPSQEYAHLSYNGDHDKYLAALKQFVSDVHHDMQLDTVYVGSIGSVPHTIGTAAISTRENIYHIRRALQDSWQNTEISPGPVVYDVALETDSIHIHFNSPDEMIPLAKRWAAAISAVSYHTGVGRGPVLQTAELAADRQSASFTFDQDLKVSDFKGRAGTKAEGWSFEEDKTARTDDHIASSRIAKNVVYLRFKGEVAQSLRASYGIDDDGAGKTIMRGATDLPVEPFYAVPVTLASKDGQQ